MRYIVLVWIDKDEHWVQFGDLADTYHRAEAQTAKTSLPWVITVVLDRERGVLL
jgi:hypothetical protein